MWDSFRVGASVPPIKTEYGCFEIYHGVKTTVAGPIYRIGTVLLDLEQPHKVVARCNMPVLSPIEDYERIGDVGNVVFACVRMRRCSRRYRRNQGILWGC